MTANTWPMNWTMIRVVMSASITKPSGSSAHTAAMTPQHDQGDVGKLLGRVQPSEHGKEVAVTRRRKRNARIAEQQREHRPECGPQDQKREHRRDFRPIQPFHERRDDELGFRVGVCRNELTPRDDADDREVDRDVDRGDRDDADHDRARDDPTWILDFVADVADVVVAEEVVDADA